MAKFRKKPITIEATQWKKMGDHPHVVLQNMGGGKMEYRIKTLEGWMLVRPGDWIVTGIQGEQYPVKKEIFEATYELVREKK